MELPLLVERVISFSWTKCIAEAPLYTHSGTLDIVSFKLSFSAIAQDEKSNFIWLICAIEVVVFGRGTSQCAGWYHIREAASFPSLYKKIIAF